MVSADVLYRMTERTTVFQNGRPTTIVENRPTILGLNGFVSHHLMLYLMVLASEPACESVALIESSHHGACRLSSLPLIRSNSKNDQSLNDPTYWRRAHYFGRPLCTMVHRADRSAEARTARPFYRTVDSPPGC